MSATYKCDRCGYTFYEGVRADNCYVCATCIAEERAYLRYLLRCCYKEILWNAPMVPATFLREVNEAVEGAYTAREPLEYQI